MERVLALLVLGDFMGLVLAALLAVGPAGFRDVHLEDQGEADQYSQKPHRRQPRPGAAGCCRPARPSRPSPQYRPRAIAPRLWPLPPPRPGPTAPRAAPRIAQSLGRAERAAAETDGGG